MHMFIWNFQKSLTRFAITVAIRDTELTAAFCPGNLWIRNSGYFFDSKLWLFTEWLAGQKAEDEVPLTPNPCLDPQVNKIKKKRVVGTHQYKQTC